MSNIDLLPRADLPVIWDAFKVKADAAWSAVNALVVTDISQKEEMALARKTRLTLREIRIAVEHKRVELGEGHLKEIQKVNGAARAIREFIEPLEARLLIQESYAERAEEKRIATLADLRLSELKVLKVCQYPTDLGKMLQADYDEYIARLRAEKAELEEANRLRVEAEKQLAEVRAEAQKRAIELQLELKAESDRLKAEARATLELAQRVALDVKQRSDAEAALRLKEQQVAAEKQQAEFRAEREKTATLEAQFAAERQEAERVRLEQEVKLRNERSVAEALRVLEREAAEQRRQADLQIEREKTAKLEAELAQERAAKQAEADAARKLAVAPDLEQLQGFSRHLQQICKPVLKTIEAEACLSEASRHFANAIFTIDKFISDRS